MSRDKEELEKRLKRKSLRYKKRVMDAKAELKELTERNVWLTKEVKES